MCLDKTQKCFGYKKSSIKKTLGKIEWKYTFKEKNDVKFPIAKQILMYFKQWVTVRVNLESF